MRIHQLHILVLLSLLIAPLSLRAAPPMPVNGAASPAGPATIALHWQVETPPAKTAFEIESHMGDKNWQSIGTSPIGRTHHYHRGLEAESTHHYRVRSVFAYGTSAWMDLGSATTTIQMNILFFFADDMGYKDIVGLRNAKTDGPTIYQTPALDQLLNESLFFRNAYCSGPRCVVARRSVLTGKYDWRPEAIPNNKSYLDHEGNPIGGGLFAGGTSKISNKKIPNNLTYGEAVQPAGYRTCYVGKYHLGQHDDQPARGPAAQGFDVSIAAGHAGAPPESYFPLESPAGSGNYSYFLPNLADTRSSDEYLTDRLTDEALGFIKDSVTHHADTPFFVTLAHYAVHTPAEAKPDDIAHFTQRKKEMAPALSKHPMAESPLIEDLGVKTRMIQDNRVYAAMMKSYDDSLAKIRRVLAATDDPRHPGKKLSETTIIVVSSDHGGKSTTPIADKKRLENDITDPVNPGRNKNSYSAYPTSNFPYRQGKTWVHEGGLKIPLIVHVPGLTPAATASDAFVHGADFFASFVDMAGAPQRPDESTDSQSFMLSAGQPAASARHELFHFFTNANKGTGNPAIAAYRKGNYKLMYFMVQRRLELYNLKHDPYEHRNVAEKNTEQAQRMFTRLYHQHLSTGAKMPSPSSNTWRTEQQDILLRNGLIPSLPSKPTAPPNKLILNELSPTAVKLEWNAADDHATHTVIYRRADSEGESGFREVGFVPIDTTAFVDDDLTPGNTYRYRLESENLAGWAKKSSATLTHTLSKK